MAFKCGLVVICILLTINISLQQICPGPLGYDIGNLTNPIYWQFDQIDACINDDKQNSTCHFYLAFCKALPLAGDCTGSSVCQFNDKQDITELGHYDGIDPFIGDDLVGFYAIFNKTKPITNKYTGNQCNLTVKIDFSCNESVAWALPVDGEIGSPPLPTSYESYTKDNCEIYMKFEYAGACFKGIPIATTTTTSTEPAPTPSKLCVPPDSKYNISALVSPPYWIFDIKEKCKTLNNTADSCTLYIAFCKPLQIIGCEGSSACLRYPDNKGGSLVVGNFTADPFTSKEINGFFANFDSGAVIKNPNTDKQCTLSIEMELKCDEQIIWDEPENDSVPGKGPVPEMFTGISDSCDIKVAVPYKGACHYTPKPEKSISAGSVILIFLCVVIATYLIVGIGYNVFVDHQSGLRVIPNYNFWAGLVLLIMQGLIASWRLITCQKAKRATYDSIKD